MDRSSQFNNAGVDCLEAGYPRIAWDLFKGALELRLAFERSTAQQERVGQNPSPLQKGGTVPAVHSTTSITDHHHNTDPYTIGKGSDSTGVFTNDFTTSLSSSHQQEQDQMGHNETILATGHVRAQPYSRLLMPHETNIFIEQAEHHMSNLSFYMEHQIVRSAVIGGNDDENNNDIQRLTYAVLDGLLRHQQELEMVLMGADRHLMSTNNTYTPSLFGRPLKLRETIPTTTSTAESLALMGNDSATIIFNLALVDHLKNPFSDHAIALYELALKLRSGLFKEDVSGIALINNIGVWCYENGDIDSAMNCMSHLSHYVSGGGSGGGGPSSSASGSSFAEEGSSSAGADVSVVGMDEDQRRALHANVEWFMNLTFDTSPAA
jgi:hypothetical protein